MFESKILFLLNPYKDGEFQFEQNDEFLSLAQIVNKDSDVDSGVL